jgi:flavin reductase (DIM6/NTAB) family NADH-FMN oxidoreductase RutF
LTVSRLRHGFPLEPLITFYIHIRNLSVFFTNLDWDFAPVIDLYWFKFPSHNFGNSTYMDDKSRKTALRMLTYGTYVLTSATNNDICAATVTWVSQASFEPPMISVCIKRESHTFDVVSKSNRFVLHLLSHAQKDFAASFFQSTEHIEGLLNGQTFEMVDALPILDLPPAYLVCHVLDVNDRGDHPMFLAEVKDVVVREDVDPLELRKTGWSYGG